jgi:hypothetical protein
MQAFLLIVGSAAPIILLVGGAVALRSYPMRSKLIIELMLLLISAPVGAWIIRLAFPPPPGAHLASDNPGQGIIYMYLALSWLLGLASWLTWLASVAIRSRFTAR